MNNTKNTKRNNNAKPNSSSTTNQGKKKRKASQDKTEKAHTPSTSSNRSGNLTKNNSKKNNNNNNNNNSNNGRGRGTTSKLQDSHIEQVLQKRIEDMTDEEKKLEKEMREKLLKELEEQVEKINEKNAAEVPPQLNLFSDNIEMQEDNWNDDGADAAVAESDGEVEQFPTDLKEYQEKPIVLAPEAELQYLKDLLYDSEDSENERQLNTTGNVPVSWYDDYDHIGYDLEGNKIQKPKREDEIDRMLATEQNPWSIYNVQTGKREIISPTDLELIKQIQRGVQEEHHAPEKWQLELNEYTDTIHPATNIHPPKSRFVPSKWEAKRIRRLAYAIQKGWIKLDEAKKEEEQKYYLIWDENDNSTNKPKGIFGRHIPAPKPPLPGHNESYNPPEEYLMDEEEKARWETLDEEDRPNNFIPQKNSSLRTTPAYGRFQRERFERCVDLYMAVRYRKIQRYADPETLLPKIPKPSELKPFPSQTTIIYLGHEKFIRSIDVDPSGQFLASASDDCTLRIWEVSTARELKRYTLPSIVYHVEWNPNVSLFMVAAVTEESVWIFSPQKMMSGPLKTNTDTAFSTAPKNDNEKMSQYVEWVKPEPAAAGGGGGEDFGGDLKLKLNLKGQHQLRYMTWHYKGDYFATVCPKANTSAVLIHHLSRKQSQNPFSKSKGLIQAVKFHPSKPYFFVATQKNVRVYNLAAQTLMKKLFPATKWISSIHVHPGGDNVLLGTFDKRVVWFDLDLGSKPYKTLRYHSLAVRSVRYHSRYPLFASCSDDGTIHLFHGQVFNDLLQNPFIVPLKVLRGHAIVDEIGVLDIMFHPFQPWIFSSGADCTIRLYT